MCFEEKLQYTDKMYHYLSKTEEGVFIINIQV